MEKPTPDQARREMLAGIEHSRRNGYRSMAIKVEIAEAVMRQIDAMSDHLAAVREARREALEEAANELSKYKHFNGLSLSWYCGWLRDRAVAHPGGESAEGGK